MNLYAVKYKKYNGVEALNIVARTPAAALEGARVHMSKNYLSGEITEVVKQQEIHRVQK